MAGTRRPTLARVDALDAIPVRNQLCKVEHLDGGLVRLLVPARRTPLRRAMKLLTSVPDYRKIELDEIGSFVWKHCDGRTSVRVLIDRLCRRYKLSRREGEVSLVQYLRTLARRNVIGLAVFDGRGRR